jgi:ribosome modulation factor
MTDRFDGREAPPKWNGRAHERGSAARHAGVPLEDCPERNAHAQASWRAGWCDADQSIRSEPVSVPREEYEALLRDKERLDYVEGMGGTYTGRYVLRMSEDNRGLRLHETSRGDGRPSVRAAIDEAMVT